MPRETDLTLEVEGRVCASIRDGNQFVIAAKSAGIGERTFYKWMRRGLAEPESVYGRFRQAVKAAEAEAEATLVATWRKHTNDNWVAAAAMLERRFPERWSRRERLEVSGTVKVKGSDAMESLLTKLARIADRPEVHELEGEILPTLPPTSSPAPELPSVSTIRDHEGAAPEVANADVPAAASERRGGRKSRSKIRASPPE